MSKSLCPHGLENVRLPYPLPTPLNCSNSCPLSRWCHKTISSSVIPFSSCLQYFQHQGLFQWLNFCIRWPKYWNFSFSISPSNKYSGLISLRTDWFDLFAVQGTLKSLPQHRISKASVLWCSAFFILQFSHLYMTTGKNVALTIWIFVGKGMSLLFNTLSRFVIDILPREKQAFFILMTAVIFVAQEYKVCHCFYCFPINLPWSDGTGCHDLSFLNVEF